VSGEPIPTLATVLEAIGSRARVYVEVKGHGIEAQVVNTIAQTADVAAVPLHSFDHRVLSRARAIDPNVQGGILLVSYLLQPEAALRTAGARDYWQEWSMVDPDLVKSVHGARGRVIAWTVNDLDVARRLADMGVDGICTDVLPTIAPAVGRAA
jgi:glycerophosphoryl diester phosphodiesterase